MDWHNGDYETRCTGLANLMRPTDVVRYDRWRHEARLGVVVLVPEELRVGYAVLGAYAKHRGRSLGKPDTRTHYPPHHPLLFLWSILDRGGKLGNHSPLIISAYEELIHA